MPTDPKMLAALLRVGRIRDCFAATQQALFADPDDCLALAYRGIASGLLADANSGISDLTNAASLAEAAGQTAVAAFALQYLGNALSNQNRHDEAFSALERSAALGLRDVGLLTGLCQTAARLGKRDAARKWGEEALFAKDAEARCAPGDEVLRRRPHPFEPNACSRNIVSYSLFGEDRFYQDCAVMTARQHIYVYPEFTARFYCAAEIPQSVCGALRAAGAEVLIVKSAISTSYAGLMWRFLPFDDSEVDVVLIRDVDSPVLPRERAGLNLWLRSEAPFYVMRDDIQHTAPILAGLWGGFTRLLPPLSPPAMLHQQRDTSRYADQNFLRNFVWPRIRKATLAIDSVYALGESVDFPETFPKYGSIHVGCSWPRKVLGG